MQATAKVFTTGNSQAVRLPKAFRVQGDEVYISKDEATGVITLVPKDAERLRRQRLEALRDYILANPFEEDFIPPRNDPWAPDPFEEDDEPPTTPRPSK